jgi:large subunit ribosomal protein L21
VGTDGGRRPPQQLPTAGPTATVKKACASVRIGHDGPLAKLKEHFMFAVIRSGGKQYKVTEGETLDIELVDFPAEGAKKITISDVLMVGNGDKFSVGNPLLSGASVGLELVEEVKAKKVIAYKYRRREGYHRTVGHRQKLSRVKITAITI